MRVESKDATSDRFVKVTGNGAENVRRAPEVKVENEVMDDAQLLHLSEFEKRELPVSDQYIMKAIERANKAINASGRTFEYRIHEKTREIMVKVIDSDTKEVIREIPPEKVLDMVAKMLEMAGIIVDERR